MALPTVLFEDESMIAFDKPSGVSVAPDRTDKTKAHFMGLVQELLGRHVASVHRIDTDASGILLCAKTKPALDFLSGQFQSKTVAMTYLACSAVLDPENAMKVVAPARDVDGRVPERFEVDLSLDVDELDPSRMRIFKRRGGKPSLTEVVTLEHFHRFVWLQCHPHTGRTHQTRLHLAAVGLPILNDTLYGDPEAVLKLSSLKRGYKGRADEKPLLRRLALHASALTVKHPVTREPVTIESPLPNEFEVALKYLRRFAS